MDSKLLGPMLFAGLLAVIAVRRIRRNIGRQQVHEKRLWFRAGLLAVVGAIIALGALARPDSLLALLAGLAGGAALGWLGLRHTVFEHTPEGRFYTPHTVIGLVVSALFLGRLVYRYVIMSRTLDSNEPAAPMAMIQRSPLTLGIFGVVVAYYVVYNLGILKKSRTAAGPDTSG